MDRNLKDDSSNLNRLISHFDNYLPLDEIEREELSLRANEKTIKRRQFILQKTDICKHYTYVVSGLFKMYAVDKAGTEHNLQFAAENEWITDLGSFNYKKPSEFYIEAIEPSILIQIERADLIFLFTKFPKFDRTFRVMIEDNYIKLENRIIQKISFTSEERYLNFLDQYSHLSNRLPNTQIASYIGITPEFLSKIRNIISKKIL